MLVVIKGRRSQETVKLVLRSTYYFFVTAIMIVCSFDFVALMDL